MMSTGSFSGINHTSAGMAKQLWKKMIFLGAVISLV
jgi:uncharacterized membrane protein YtjA (UPF0391 family)